MQCRCPLCGGITQVPLDMIHFMVRCDRCSQLLRPAIAVQPDGREAVKAEPAGPGRVREHVSTGAGIAELLCPPRRARVAPPVPEPPAICLVEEAAKMEALPKPEATDDLQALAEIASAKPIRRPSRRPGASKLGATIIATVFLVLALGAGALLMALKGTNSIARGATVAKGAVPRPTPHVSPPRHDPAPPSQSTATGELFTHVKPR